MTFAATNRWWHTMHPARRVRADRARLEARGETIYRGASKHVPAAFPPKGRCGRELAAISG